MDEQYEQMGLFQDALERFNERLHTSMRDLKDCHESVAPIWQDSMRTFYDQQWEPLDQQVTNFLDREVPAYDDFLRDKLNHLRDYLFGGR